MARISVICISLRAGGTEKMVSRVSNHLAQVHMLNLITLADMAPFYPLRSDIVLLQPEFGPRSELGPQWYIRVLNHLRGSLRRFRPDLVLCFGESIAPAVIAIARLAGIRVLVFNRASPLSSLKGARGLINPITYPLAEKVIVQTRTSAELLKSRYRRSRFEVLPNPIDRSFEVQPLAAREKRIINVGRLGGQKNQQDLIRAFAGLEDRDEWRLDLVGEGTDRDALECLSNDLGVGRQVRFLGERSDVATLLEQARIFAFTSLTEGFPNALAEALAAGCACVSYDCPTGPADIIENGISGLLVANGDRQAFKDALVRLAASATLQERLAGGARERIMKFSTERIFVRLDELVDRSLAT